MQDAGITHTKIVYYNNQYFAEEARAMCTKSKLQTVLKEVKNTSERLYGDKSNRIILYDSYARGNNTEESDMDIMIALNSDTDKAKSCSI